MVSVRSASSSYIRDTTGITPSLPAGWQPGDLFLAVHAVGSSTEVPIYPADWNVAQEIHDISGVGDRVLWKIAEVGDTDPVFTQTSTTNRNNIVLILALADVDQVNPVLGIAGTSETGTGTKTTDALVVGSDYFEVNFVTDHPSASTVANTAWTPPSGVTIQSEGYHAVNASQGSSAAAGTLDAGDSSAGTTPTRAYTSTISANGSAFTVAIAPSGVAPSPSLVNRWTGAVSDDGATVSVKTSNTSSVRLKVATNQALTTGVAFTSAVAPDANNRAKIAITGKNPNTQYYYGVEMDGTLDDVNIGSFKTFPTVGAATSFEFAFASCMDSGTTDTGARATDALTRIQARNPLFMAHLGDIHYDNISVDSETSFFSSYDAQLAVSSIGDFFAQIPTTYIWSDHDFGGNNSVGSATAAPAAQSAYREVVPHYTLPVADSVEQTWVIGRIRFIHTDERSHKSAQTDTDDASKTMLGTTQKTWFKDLITNCDEEVILWLGDTPLTGATVAGDDHWASYDTERQELLTHFSTSGKHIVRLNGDMHGVAADDGTAVGIPVCIAAPLNQKGSSKGGPWSEGNFPTVLGTVVRQYGYMVVTDNDTSIDLDYTGYDTSDVAQVTMSMSFTVDPATVTEPPVASGEGSLADQARETLVAELGDSSESNVDLFRQSVLYTETNLTPANAYWNYLGGLS